MKYKISIIGSFGFNASLYDGQTIKTKEIAKLLESKFGVESICRVDTHGWKRRPWQLFGEIVKATRHSDYIVMLPAHGAVKFIPRIVMMSKKPSTKVYYSVIGGWLPEFIDDKPRLASLLRRLDSIWVETRTMCDKLQKRGFCNIDVIPNFKELNILDEKDLTQYTQPILRLCVFSRINKDKGITQAIESICEVNRRIGAQSYTLDCYGIVQDDYKEEFERLCREHSDCIKYMGVADPHRSSEIIKDYFALIFPTLYRTEGIPGTIIDAYSCGLPVISARWQSFRDMVDEGQTGIGYPQGDQQALVEILLEIHNDPVRVLSMKNNCLDKAQQFTPAMALDRMLSSIGIGGVIC